MKPIIEVQNLSKLYQIGAKEAYGSLRDEIMQAITAPFKRSKQSSLSDDNTLWALKDVSFSVNEGEVVGIIGRNGAGKSTLLKILSRITEPTSGKITMRGRVASLLEVGTGFHPELTGRENIFLNGAVLGMTNAEIRRKFDEIVAFSEIEKFLDTPVKRYSSGMYVRLAFAVAAHLEPEILIIDEVLAVGDVQFQKKCLGKMGEVAKGGRTVLFVSHNMGAIRRLCSEAILLESGQIKSAGLTEEVIGTHLADTAGEISSIVTCPAGQNETRGCATHLLFFTKDGIPQAQFRIGEPWKIVLDFEIFSSTPEVIAAVGIINLDSVPIITYWSKPRDLFPGKYRVYFECNVPLKKTELQIGVGLSSREHAFYFAIDIGRVSISDVAVGEQPFRESGAGILLSIQESEIKSLDEVYSETSDVFSRKN